MKLIEYDEDVYGRPTVLIETQVTDFYWTKIGDSWQCTYGSPDRPEYSRMISFLERFEMTDKFKNHYKGF